MLVTSSEISCDKSDQVRGHRDVGGTAAHLQVGFLLQGPPKPWVAPVKAGTVSE